MIFFNPLHSFFRRVLFSHSNSSRTLAFFLRIPMFGVVTLRFVPKRNRYLNALCFQRRPGLSPPLVLFLHSQIPPPLLSPHPEISLKYAVYSFSGIPLLYASAASSHFLARFLPPLPFFSRRSSSPKPPPHLEWPIT